MIQAIKSAPASHGSDLVIPAVPGEFYAYSAEFADVRPLYALMKCKANKARPLAAAGELGLEANLIFLFGDPHRVQACAMNEAHAFGFLGDVASVKPFGETWIAATGITVENFYDLRSRQDVVAMMKICQASCAKRETSIVLELGTVVAMMTDGGKYGLFFVKELTQESMQIDACHILV